MSQLDSLRLAVSQSPDNVPLLLLYGQACLEESAKPDDNDPASLAEAERSFQRVLELDARQREARLGIARILFGRGKVDEAAVRAESLLRENLKFAPAHLFLSRLYLSENDRQKAAEHYEEAVAADGSVSDRGLEKQLGRELRGGEGRRAVAGSNSSSQENSHKSSDLSEDEPTDDFDLPFDENLPAEYPPPFPPREPIKSQVLFQHVGGYEGVKDTLRLRMLHPLQRPDLCRSFGRKTGGSVLLYGPPGTGKSLMAEAIAGESRANYLSVGIHEIVDPYFGPLERNLHQLFDYARTNTPAVVFLDHLETLGSQRHHPGQIRTLSATLLDETDFSIPGNEGLIVVASTDSPWLIDPSLLRPGRFGRPLYMGPPSAEERMAIIAICAAQRPVADLDVAALVAATQGFTGAEIEEVFEIAGDACIREAVLTGNLGATTTEALVAASQTIVPGFKIWLRQAREHREHLAPFPELEALVAEDE